jgi:hypothetical protein
MIYTFVALTDLMGTGTGFHGTDDRRDNLRAGEAKKLGLIADLLEARLDIAT